MLIFSAIRSSILCVLLLGFMACQSHTATDKNEVATQNAVQGAIRNLSVVEFEQQLNQPNTLLLDVRTPEEYAQGHLPNATLLDIQAKDFDQQIAALDKNKTVLVYCAAGGRSADAAERLKKTGFRQINNLEKGYNDWAEQGKAVAK